MLIIFIFACNLTTETFPENTRLNASPPTARNTLRMTSKAGPGQAAERIFNASLDIQNFTTLDQMTTSGDHSIDTEATHNRVDTPSTRKYVTK
jgi:hypothetical protein